MATLKEISEQAGVSIRTLRRVLNNDNHVKADTFKKVKKILAKTGYTPNLLARGLRNKRTGLVGIITNSLDYEVEYKKYSAIQYKLIEKSYGSLLGLTGNNLAIKKQLCLEYTRFCDGIIFLKTPEEEILEVVNSLNTPYVISDSYLKTPHAISINRECGIIDAIKKQHDKYKKILFLTNYLEENEYRRLAFEKGAENNFETQFEIIHCETNDFEGGLCAVADVAKIKHSLSVCYNDRIASGLLKGLYLAGCDIPRDYGIIGFDNDDFTKYTHKSISTITQSIDDLAEKTLLLLQLQIDGKKIGKILPVKTDFISRETTEN